MSKALIITTFNREDNFKKVFESVDSTQFERIVVIHDGGGTEYSLACDEVENTTYIKMSENKGVGTCKQTGIDYILKNTKSNHIFIIEDDMFIKDNEVWDYYVNFSKCSGVRHTNWNDYRQDEIKFEVDYNDYVGIVTRAVEGSFSYFHRNIFEYCEFPSDMKNAFEHISVELQLIEKGLLPPFWNFICPKNSGKYLTDLNSDSTITNKGGYRENYTKAYQAFVERHHIEINRIPDCDKSVVIERLKFLNKNYSG